MKPNNDMKKRLSRTIFRNLIVPLLALGAFAIMALMSKGSSPSAPQQQQNVVQQQTTEAPAETTEQPEIKGNLGSNGVIQEEGWGYLYIYTLDGKSIGVMEVDGVPQSVVSWDSNVNPEKDFDKILNSPKTVKKYNRKERLEE